MVTEEMITAFLKEKSVQESIWDGRTLIRRCLEAALDEDERKTTYRVHWTYDDQFGLNRRDKSGHLPTCDAAVSYAALKFAEIVPEAWWIEKVTTVEYHDPGLDR